MLPGRAWGAGSYPQSRWPPPPLLPGPTRCGATSSAPTPPRTCACSTKQTNPSTSASAAHAPRGCSTCTRVRGCCRGGELGKCGGVRGVAQLHGCARADGLCAVPAQGPHCMHALFAQPSTPALPHLAFYCYQHSQSTLPPSLPRTLHCLLPRLCRDQRCPVPARRRAAGRVAAGAAAQKRDGVFRGGPRRSLLHHHPVSGGRGATAGSWLARVGGTHGKKAWL